MFPKLKFKLKIKFKSPIELQQPLYEIEGLPLNILIYFFYSCTHLS
jgi:hypothetical protein